MIFSIIYLTFKTLLAFRIESLLNGVLLGVLTKCRQCVTL